MEGAPGCTAGSLLSRPHEAPHGRHGGDHAVMAASLGCLSVMQALPLLISRWIIKLRGRHREVQCSCDGLVDQGRASWGLGAREGQDACTHRLVCLTGWSAAVPRRVIDRWLTPLKPSAVRLLGRPPPLGTWLLPDGSRGSALKDDNTGRSVGCCDT
ncbi:hypothetical protein HaLaN_09316 [Haematococcus lacustris]|uniref:Uncharacterized protein n=1 Tax=Haematococcus lacustris TaxID=44745 RepID=A0A699YV44_HAELA|nr:hypothetical protein HaLaN_09316 [Haematococcus lacustris]